MANGQPGFSTRAKISALFKLSSEAQLQRMVGAGDGITDALFNFTQPVSGSYFWCPPMRNGKLDLQALEL